MRPLIKNSLIAFVAVIGIGTTYVAGYFQGYLGGLGHGAMAEAVGTIVTLDAIRDDKDSAAIRLLETKLDTQIIMHAKYQGSSFQLAKLLDESSDEVLIRKVAEYRKSYPSDFADPDFQELIKNGLHVKK
jgi:hypothetical protein